jgi:UDP-N-acetylmuramyl tripeptide synthase
LRRPFVVRIRLRRRPRSWQAAADGRGGRALGEDGDAIVEGILRGFTDRTRVRVIRDRAEAIRAALADAGSGDIVLIAGKGHEDYQIYGEESRPFSDRAVVLAALDGS